MSSVPADPVAAGSPGARTPPAVASLAVTARVAAAAAAAVLVGSGSGSATVTAVLLGTALADRRAGAAAVLAALAAGIRFRTDGFGDLAGIQSVLGAAGEVGPTTAAASAWLAGAAVLLAVSAVRAASPRWLALAPALPAGLLAAALVAGPGPDQLARRVLASAAGVAAAAGVALVVRAAGDPLARSTGSGRTVVVTGALPWAAVACGVAAVVLAGWPS